MVLVQRWTNRPVHRVGSPEKTHTYLEKIDSRGGISPSGETMEFLIKGAATTGYPYVKKK